MAKIDFLKGRDENVLWLMFKAAELVNEYDREGEHVRAYRYMDGKDPVLFVDRNGYVEVTQPGVCLFQKMFLTNASKTKWERM